MKNVGFDAFFTTWKPEKTEAIANEAARLGLFQQSIHSPFSGEYRVRYLWEGGELEFYGSAKHYKNRYAFKELLDCCSILDVEDILVDYVACKNLLEEKEDCG